MKNFFRLLIGRMYNLLIEMKDWTEIKFIIEIIPDLNHGSFI